MMGMFMRITLMILVIAILSFSFSGCIVKNNDVVQYEVSEKTRIRFWLRAVTTKSVTGNLVEEYNIKNKDDVEIQFEVYGENYKNVVYIALQSGNPPDIFELNGGLTVIQLAKAGYILSLDDYINQDFRQDFYEDVFTQKQLYYNGSLYAVPERIGYWRLIYSKTLFEKAGLDPDSPPTTLEELREYAKIITESGKGEYYGYGCPLKTGSTVVRFLDNLSAISGLTGEYAFDWNIGKFDFQKQKPFLQFLLDLYNDNSIYPDALNLDLEVSRALFGKGEFAMMIDGNWVASFFNNNELICTVDWDSAPIPIFAGATRCKGYAWYDMAKLISSKTRYPDKSWEFIKFLLDNQDVYVKNGEPLRTKINANKPEYFPEGHKGFLGFADVENNVAFPFQVHNLINADDIKIEEKYKSVFLGIASIDEVLSELTKEYNKSLSEAIQEGVIDSEDINISDFDYFDR